jgi:hypothetical protein
MKLDRHPSRCCTPFFVWRILLRSLLSNTIFTIQPPVDMTTATTVSPSLQAVRASQTTLSIYIETQNTTCLHSRFQQNASLCAPPTLLSSPTISQPLSPQPIGFHLSNSTIVPARTGRPRPTPVLASESSCWFVEDFTAAAKPLPETDDDVIAEENSSGIRANPKVVGSATDTRRTHIIPRVTERSCV